MWRGGAAGEKRRQSPRSGGMELKAECQDCSLPAGLFSKKKVVRKPGHMRRETLQQIGFQPLSVCEPLSPTGLENHNKKHYTDYENGSLKRKCKNEMGLFHCNKNDPISPKGATKSPSAGNIVERLRILADFRAQEPEDPILPLCPTVAVHKGDDSFAYSLYSEPTSFLEPLQDVPQTTVSQEKEGIHPLGQMEVSDSQECESNDIACSSLTLPGHFISSFSFIQLSLNLASTANGVGGPTNCSEPKVVGSAARAEEATSQKVTLSPMGGQKFKCQRDTREDDKLQDCETLLHLNPAFSCSTDSLDVASAGSSVTSGYESSSTVSDHSWESLMKKYEPVLQDCLLGNRNLLKVNSLINKLQRLQEKAVTADDYGRADKFRRKLEKLEKEKYSLKFQIPSQNPIIGSFLDRLKVQVQKVLYGNNHRFNTEAKQLFWKSEQNILSFPCHEKAQVSAIKRDRLLEEKERIQKEIKALRARLSVLEMKDQQLLREIQEQDHLIHEQDCELTALINWSSLEELQTLSKALADTSEASHKILCSLDFPEPIKRLQEKEQSLNMIMKDTAAKVCTSQKLCSTLRKQLSDIETQLPALLEAKMLAVSGANFCTAKDLAEEIKSLTAERERLEGLLNEWFVLSAKNVQKLKRMKDSYKRLKEEIEHEKAAFEKKMMANTLNYMKVLEEKLQRCGSQLLERVWEVDLEACQLLMQGFQLKDDDGSVSEGEDSQTDEVQDTANTSLSTRQEQSKHFPTQDSKWSALQEPVIQSKHETTHWELKEEFSTLTTELEEKCEEISDKLMLLEDQLQIAIYGSDEDLVQSLQREIQMVKETLQAMLVQLQPTEEAEEDTAAELLGDSWCPGKQSLKE